MTFLIIALLIVLAFLSWKYMMQLEPAGVFAAMWIALITAVLLMQNFIILRFSGILYIVICVILFMLGTIFCDYVYHPHPSHVTLTFRKKWALPVLAVLFVCAMVTPLYSIILHGFSIQALLDMRELLEMNKNISEDRYSGVEARNLITQVFLIFCYAAPLFGGFCYRWVNKYVKVLCILSLIPGIFVALTQSMKMGMVSGFILWATGFFICSFSYHLSLKIKLRNVIISAIIFILFFGILFFSMVFRTGEVSEGTVALIQEKFVSYALGQFHCFDMWYTTYEPTNYSWGTKTFMGISNVIGLEQRSQGVYSEFYQIGKNGFFGIANIFTIFRSLIEDFGEAGTCLLMFLLGLFSKMSLKNLILNNSIFMHQTIMTAVYAYLMWSFATSFFAYTSYIALFVVAYILFRILQKETQPC